MKIVKVEEKEERVEKWRFHYKPPPASVWENKEALTQQRPFPVAPLLSTYTRSQNVKYIFHSIHHHRLPPKIIYRVLGVGAGKHPPASNAESIFGDSVLLFAEQSCVTSRKEWTTAKKLHFSCAAGFDTPLFTFYSCVESWKDPDT